MEESLEIYECPEVGGGKGLRALRDFYAGEVILREKPFIRMPKRIFDGDQDDAEEFVTRKLNRATSSDREAYFNLVDSECSESKTILGIFYTNDMNYIDGSAGLFLIMARSNHSCSPNADFITRDDLDCQDLVATEDIKSGQEVTISYLPSSSVGSDVRSIRRTYLRKWYNFDCACKICSMENALIARNDRIRKTFKEDQNRILSPISLKELQNLSGNLNLIRGIKIPFLLQILENILENALRLNSIELTAEFIVRGVKLADIIGDQDLLNTWEERRASSMVSIGGRLYLFPQLAC